MRTKIPKDYSNVRVAYLTDKGIFSTDTLKAKAVKDYIRTRLTTSEQTIITLYAECGSLSKLSKILGIPKSTIHIEVQKIQKKIRKWFTSTSSALRSS